jgi:hypothetical protein
MVSEKLYSDPHLYHLKMPVRDLISHTNEGYRSVHMWMKNLWDLTREYNEHGNLVPLPSYVCITFTNPEIICRMTRIRNRFPRGRMIGRCIVALVVNKLVTDINSPNVLVNNDELACLSAILGTESHDVRLSLGQPGTIQLVNLVSLAWGDVRSLRADRTLPHKESALQETLAILSQALPAQANDEPLDQTVALATVSDDKFERAIVSRLHGLLKMCIPGASSLMEEVRTSCLRMCLKTLWHCGKVYQRSPWYTLPSYFPLVLARPETLRHFQTDQDPVARITGCCFGALIVSKLVNALTSPISFGDGVLNAELACISAILGTEHREVLLLPHQLHVINLRNVVSFMSGEIDTFTTVGMPVDILDIAQHTLYALSHCLNPDGLQRQVRTMAQKDSELLLGLCGDVKNALDFDQLKNETAKTLDRLRQILDKPLPASREITRYSDTEPH